MKYFLTVLLLLGLSVPATANQDSLSYFNALGQAFSQDISAAGDDALYLFQSLGNSGSCYSLTVAGVVIAATGGAYLVDDNIRKEAATIHTSQRINLSAYIREYGGTYSIIGSSVGLYTLGLLTQSEEVRTSGRLVLEAFIVSGVVNGGLKVLLGRGRPYLNLGKDKFKPLNFLNDYNSLPSGHTTVAFTISTVLAEHIDRWWASAGLYTIAAATGISRIYDDKHWLSDVVLGASIGYFSGKLITAAHQAQRSTNSTTLRLYPTIGGVGCTYQF